MLAGRGIGGGVCKMRSGWEGLLEGSLTLGAIVPLSSGGVDVSLRVSGSSYGS